MVIEIAILNHELHARYIEKVPEIVKKHGGKYLVMGGKVILVRGGEVIPMFGNWDPERIVLIEFDTVENLRNCFNSAEYLEIAPFREHSPITKSIIVNGSLSSK